MVDSGAVHPIVVSSSAWMFQVHLEYCPTVSFPFCYQRHMRHHGLRGPSMPSGPPYASAIFNRLSCHPFTSFSVLSQSIKTSTWQSSAYISDILEFLLISLTHFQSCPMVHGSFPFQNSQRRAILPSGTSTPGSLLHVFMVLLELFAIFLPDFRVVL